MCWIQETKPKLDINLINVHSILGKILHLDEILHQQQIMKDYIVRIQWESQMIEKYEWRQTLLFISFFLILDMHIVDYQLCDRIYIILESLIRPKR